MRAVVVYRAESFDFEIANASCRSTANRSKLYRKFTELVDERTMERNIQLQRLVRCNNALRFLLRLHSLSGSSISCTCACAVSENKRGYEHDGIEDSEKLHHTWETRYRMLIEAVRLLKEELEAEKQRAARHGARQVCADVLRFFLFVAGIYAATAFLPPPCLQT